jgi:segregation and condensation protein B
LRALQDRGLIEESGREETPGRPVLYGTTPGFLERLGLPSLASLPSLAPLLGPDAEDMGGDLADTVVDTDLAAEDSDERPEEEDMVVSLDEQDAPDAGILEDDRPA